MKVDDAILALRDEGVSQRAGQLALESAKASWRRSEGALIVIELARYAEGRGLDECPLLSRLLDDVGAARAMLRELITPQIAELRGHPLGQVPFRHQYQNGIGMIQIAAAGEAALSLVLYEQRDVVPPMTVCFSDNACYEIVLSGAGTARILTLLDETGGTVRTDRTQIALSPGSNVAIESYSTSKQMLSVEGTMVVLRLSRTPENPRASCEYRMSDGVLIHRASGNRTESRREMYAALLGAMGRSDAASVLAKLTKAGGDQLRWQALRNCLTLDGELGFRALCEIGDLPEDSLQGPAKALRAQLLAAHPQFAELESERCPA